MPCRRTGGGRAGGHIAAAGQCEGRAAAAAVRQRGLLERDEIRLGPFSSRAPDAAQQECCEPGSTLLCMGLFSRFFVQALPCTAEGTLCRVRDTKSLAPRAYGTN